MECMALCKCDERERETTLDKSNHRNMNMQMFTVLRTRETLCKYEMKSSCS